MDSVAAKGKGTTPVMRRLGDFILLEEIGRGGMGRVYHAKQISLDREVALKVLPKLAGLDEDSVTRFRREAEAAGRLSHPGIVPIYAVGEIDETYYFAMERVDGPSLFQMIERISTRSLESLRRTLIEEAGMDVSLLDDPPEFPRFLQRSLYAASCAHLIMELSGALTAAHQGQVIHRDVKPSNILLHKCGRPVLVDFGLARDELALSMTQTGEAVGTPAYMAPEQAAGSKMIDGQVDVYGLGASLYELLTMRPPFTGSNSAEVMRAILDEEPVPPRRINPRVPRDLETIVLTCLAKDKNRRYATPAELGADLRAFLTGGEIGARRAGLASRVAQRLQRGRQSAWVAVVAILIALVVGLAIGLVRLNNQRHDGMLALDNAKILLLQGKARESQAAFLQAQMALDDPGFVSERRLDSFRAAFPSLYAQDRRRELTVFLDTLPAVDVDRPEYHEFRRRLRGIGHIEVAKDIEKGVQITVRRIADGEIEPRERALPDDGRLPVGEYLLRVTARGMAPVVRAVEVERDTLVILDPRFKPMSQVPPGMVLVAPTNGEHQFAVDRTELTRGRYGDFLHTLDDRNLAAELEPAEKSSQRMEQPVTGLSFWQARTAAALLGGHLMSRAEYSYAATGGVSHLQYPWGRTFDRGRVVGDPRYASDFAPVGSKPLGASPNGILDLVGNAAEMLAADRGGHLFVAGGHFGSKPEELTVRSFQALSDPSQRLPFVGMRIARFLPVGDDGKANGRVEARVAELEKLRRPFAITNWLVSGSGRVQVDQDLLVEEGVGSLAIPALDGFRDISVLAKYRTGRRLDIQAVSPTSEKSGYSLDLPHRSSMPRVTVLRRVEPLTGLRGLHDSYLLHIPLESGWAEAMDRVELPKGSHVDEVWPEPDELFYLDGAPVLIWQSGSDYRRREPGVPAMVRFRRDGALTERWPALAPPSRIVENLFRALALDDRKALERLLASDCVLAPNQRGKREVLRNVRGLGLFSDARIIDVTAVGELVCVEIRVRWRRSVGPRAENGAAVSNWPMSVVLRRTMEGLQVVRLKPVSAPDLGRIEARTYIHDGLDLDVRIEGETRMAREFDGMSDLQLKLRPPAGDPAAADYWVTLTGFADGESDPQTVRMRLTDGRELVSKADAVPRTDATGVQVAGHVTLTANEHWLFPARDGKGCTRESWCFLNLGNRRFLLRCVARGRNRAVAEQRFSLCEDWFRSVTSAVRIH